MVIDAQVMQQNVVALLVGGPRLLALFHFCPFLGGTSLLASVRMGVVASLFLFLYPCIIDKVPAVDFSHVDGFLLLAGLMLKEMILGYLLAMLSGLAFWTVEGAGMFIDNQRGAAQASDTNPVSGDQSSPTGSFFSMSAIYLFYSSGAFLAFLGAIYASYAFWPPCEVLPADLLRHPELAIFFARKVAILATNIVLIAAPVVLACLLVDIGLGLVNRFASQLQVYVLAMPIKSGIAILLLLFYFGMLMKNADSLFDVFHADLLWLRRMMP